MDRMTKQYVLKTNFMFPLSFQTELLAHIQDLAFVAGDPNETLRIMQEMGCRWLKTFYPEKEMMLKIWGWQKS